MPTLNWIGKDKVISHHQDVEYHVLEHEYGFTADGDQTDAETGSGNMIIHGDNLTALKSLLPEYEGRIDCIYIDPPYNTGNENWVYNDNVNDPRIKRWLGEVVGKEGEDLSRHDKWCCMMYPRLRLLKQLMSTDAKLVISIGFHELHNIICMCKEIFSNKQVVVVTVQTSGGKPSAGFNYLQEYLIFVVSKDFEPNLVDSFGGTPRRPFEGLTLSTFNKVTRPNQAYPIFIDPTTECIVGTGRSLQEQINDGTYIGEKENFTYDYSVAPDGLIAVWPVTSKGKECVWRHIATRLMGDWKKGYIKVTKNKSAQSQNEYSVQYLPEGLIKKINNGTLDVLGHEENKPTLILGDNETEGSSIPTIWYEKDFYTVKGSDTLKNILPVSEKKFEYPKSPQLIETILQAISNEDSIILDSFAGSGTTAHAVLDLNKKDGGNRKFILIEMMDYADTITAERVKRVITGYPYKGKKEEEIYSKKLTPKNILNGEKLIAEAQAKADAEAGNYAKVSKPKIQDNCLKVIGTIVTDELMPGLGGAFDYYELGPALFDSNGFLNEAVGEDAIRGYVYYSETRQHLTRPRSEESKYLLDTYNGTAYYFYYEPGAATTLDFDSPLHIAEKAELYIIYADVCCLPEDYMRKNHIIFKKIPRDIRKF